LGETDEGVAAAEAGVAVLLGFVVMRSIHVVVVVVVLVEVVVVVMVEGMMTEISATMIGVGGLEAVVLDVEQSEVEALGEGGIEVRSGKVVLKEGLRLSNGIGKRNRGSSRMRETLMTTGMALQ